MLQQRYLGHRAQQMAKALWKYKMSKNATLSLCRQQFCSDRCSVVTSHRGTNIQLKFLEEVAHTKCLTGPSAGDWWRCLLWNLLLLSSRIFMTAVWYMDCCCETNKHQWIIKLTSPANFPCASLLRQKLHLCQHCVSIWWNAGHLNSLSLSCNCSPSPHLQKLIQPFVTKVVLHKWRYSIQSHFQYDHLLKRNSTILSG